MEDSQTQYTMWKQTQLKYSHLWALGLGITSLLTIIANLMVILAVVKDPQRTLRRIPSNLLIASQSLADLLVGAVLEPLCIWWFMTFHQYAITTIEISSSIFIVSSIIHVLALSYDRHVAVVTPLLYASRITTRRTYISTVFIWLYSTFYTCCRTLLTMYYNKHHVVAIITGLNTVLPAFAALVIYVCLFLVIKKYKKQSESLDSSGRATMQAYQRQRKMTVVLVAACLLFVICLTPWFVFYQFIDACPECEHNKAIEMYLFCAFYYLFMFKSLLNPFLYAWRLSKFRRAISHIIPCCCRCAARRVSATSSTASSHYRGKFSVKRSVGLKAHEPHVLTWTMLCWFSLEENHTDYIQGSWGPLCLHNDWHIW